MSDEALLLLLRAARRYRERKENASVVAPARIETPIQDTRKSHGKE
jgi:hypothetical protein